MSLHKLAYELDETARQTEAMAQGVAVALSTLSSQALPCDVARHQAIAQIVAALQGQDRVEQRCRTLATAIRRLALGDQSLDRIWADLTMDELRLTSPSARSNAGDVDLF